MLGEENIQPSDDVEYCTLCSFWSIVQDVIEKYGGQNDQLLIMLFRAYLTFPVSEFRHFVVRNKESWEKGDIMDLLVLMNDAEPKFKSLQ